MVPVERLPCESARNQASRRRLCPLFTDGDTGCCWSQVTAGRPLVRSVVLALSWEAQPRWEP